MKNRDVNRIIAVVTFALIGVITITSSVYLVFKDRGVRGVQDVADERISPYITNLMPNTAYINEEYIFVPNISSNKDNSSVVTVVEGPSWLSVDDMGVVRGYPNETGTFKVVLKTTNSFGSSLLTDYIIVKNNE